MTAEAIACTQCHERIDLCEFCEEPACPSPICYHCMAEALGMSAPQPHAHGG